MNILIATVKIPFVVGGAEFCAEELMQAIKNQGHKVDMVSVPMVYDCPDQVLDSILACRMLQVSAGSVDKVIALQHPAYLINHPNKVIWLLHQHRQVYDLWDNSLLTEPIHQKSSNELRNIIIKTDTQIIPEAKKVFTISKSVSKRLKKFCDIDALHLYQPPPQAKQCYCAKAQDYFYYPSRFNKLKRQELLIEALFLCKEPVKVIVSGDIENIEYIQNIKKRAVELGVFDQITWLSYVSEADKYQLYANSIAVIYLPIDEGYGFVTLEAMLSSKSVICCTDSGEPLEFIRDGESGLVVEPDANEIAERLDQLWCNRNYAKKLGKRAYDYYQTLNINWDNVLEHLFDEN